MAPDLCLPVNNGLASIALKCSKTGAGMHVHPQHKTISINFQFSPFLITVNLIQYFSGACGFAIGSTPYAVNTCAAASSALPKGYGRTIGPASFPDVALKLSQSTEQLTHSSLRVTPSEKTSRISRTHTLINEPLTEEEIVAELTQVMSAAGTEVASFIASCAQPNTNYAAIIHVTQVFLFLVTIFFFRFSIANPVFIVFLVSRSYAPLISAVFWRTKRPIT